MEPIDSRKKILFSPRMSEKNVYFRHRENVVNKNRNLKVFQKLHPTKLSQKYFSQNSLFATLSFEHSPPPFVYTPGQEGRPAGPPPPPWWVPPAGPLRPGYQNLLQNVKQFLIFSFNAFNIFCFSWKTFRKTNESIVLLDCWNFFYFLAVKWQTLPCKLLTVHIYKEEFLNI